MRVIFTLFFFIVLVATVWFLNQRASAAESTTSPNETGYTVSEQDTVTKQEIQATHIVSINNAATSQVQPVADQSSTATNFRSVTAEINTTQFVNYAKTFIGTPYVYGSMNPAVGFDCSGFINYVAQHFSLEVPRSSVQFTNLGTEVSTTDAQPGDFILFTGSDASSRVVGHMGIVTTNINGELEFIHSTSGKAKGVTISTMSDHYKERFVKVIRLLPGQTA